MAARQVGFIGLGAMGDGQAKNLIKAGFTVRAFDIDPAAVESVVAAGGVRAESPADAARDVDPLFVLVFTAAQAEAVLFGADGAVTTLPSGATVVLHTTGRPEDAADGFARALGRNPNYAPAHNNLANLRREAGDHRAAAEGYRRALALVPDYADAHYNLSVALTALGELDALGQTDRLFSNSRHDVLV